MSKAPKLTPQDKVRAAREERRQRKAAALPPIPAKGGAWLVNEAGQLVRDPGETPSNAGQEG